MKVNRKQKYFFTLVILLQFSFLCSQKDIISQTNTFSIGIEGGVGSRSLSGSKIVYDHTESDFTYIAGISGQYSLTYNYSIKSGIYFQKKGAKKVNTITVGFPIKEFRLEYFTIPVMFKFAYGSNVKFFINTGPYIGILLSANEISYEPETYDIKNIFKSIDLGISGGIGLDIQIGNTKGISLELRDDLGLLNTSDESYFLGGNVKNNTVNFILGFAY